jgi:hypothetical protein
MGLTVVPGNMIEDGTVTDSNFTNTTITSADMALDPRNASNISSGSVPLAQLGNVPAIDYTGIEDDIALLGFKAAANGSLAKYNLLDQTVDAFEDASGIDASASTNETRDGTGKYYSGGAPATGGTITTHGSYTVHSFLSGTTSFVTGATGSVAVLMVAGGGGGGCTLGARAAAGGSGGGGGLLESSSFSLPAGTYSAVVGAGGAGGIGEANAGGWTNASSGSNTTFGNASWGTATATGGGRGGAPDVALATVGGSGGGGGGHFDGYDGASDGKAGNQADSNGLTGFGNDGGDGGQFNGGGGGGAGGVGGDNGGAAGAGRANLFRTGSNVTYAAGGNGKTQSVGHGTDGAANTGTGGEGGYDSSAGSKDGGDGGSGIVVVRYLTGALDGANDMTLVSNATAAQAAPTKGDIVFTYTNGAGTAVINTNITAEISADGGSTWTAFTLASQGTTGGHTILTSHDQTITSTITAPWNMKYRIKTLVQSVALQTRIQAVSLGWS